MNKIKNKNSVRWFCLVAGVVTMLFAGVLYAWSILKAPLSAEFGWSPSALALNFTLAMTFFCIGGLLGAAMSNKVLEMTGGYNGAFVMLLALTFVAMILNFFIRKP